MRKVPEQYIEFNIMPQMHMVYAGTWYSLAVAILGLAYFRFGKTPKRGRWSGFQSF